MHNIDEGIYQRLFEQSNDPMWLIIDHKFELCNDAAVQELGYADQSELQNTHPSQLSPEYQSDGRSSFLKAEEILAETNAQGHNRFDWMHCKKNGENIPVEVTMTKLPNPTSEVFFGVWRDISKRKKLEQDLIVARENAEMASYAKSKFLSMMSHELRTPLNAVLGFSDMLRSGISGELNEKQKGITQSIHSGGEILLHLVEDLLNMAEIEQGNLRLNIRKVKAVDIQEKALNLVKSLAEKHNVSLHHSNIPPHLRYLKADQIRSVQILVNLLSNAIKYSKPGGNVWFNVKIYKNYIRFLIIDDGLGIDEKHTDAIFEPFNRGDKVDSGVEGTGLGLPICKRLAKAMNGSCGFHSVYLEGSTFWLDLPIAKE